MSLRLKPILKWLGYSPGERRSSFILMVLLLLMITARFTICIKPDPIEIVSDSMFIAGLSRDGAYVEEVRDAPAQTAWKDGEAARNQKTQARVSINLNSCDSAELERLPFLGPVLSGRIIKYRNLLGGFVSVKQLKEVYGISDTAFTVLSGRFFTDTAALRKIDINKASFGELLRHPYLDRNEVQSIISYRDVNKGIRSADDLVGEGILTSEKAEKLKPYLLFSR